MSFRWSDKRVRELLVELSQGGKAFPTTPSKRAVRGPHGYRYPVRGHFHIGGAYGGVRLDYILPYSGGAVHNLTSGYISSGKLADYLLARGSDGLARDFRRLEKQYKESMKRRMELEMKREGK
jgi:hypothetical protein